jgi:tetratricopeptide (TPR) repeat protein
MTLRSVGMFGQVCVAVLAAVGLQASASDHDMAGMAGMGPHHHRDGPAPAEKLGVVSFPNSCAAQSKAGLVRGVALLHSFGYVKAQQQFEAVAKADPDCAVAYWGVAMSRYHALWEQPAADDLKRGREELAKARAIAAATSKVTPRERAYIDALGAFYDPADAPYHARADAYAAKMDALHAAYPGDVEAAAFDALAILAAASPSDTSLEPQRRALAILKPLFAAHPDHPGLAHYIIHTCDTPVLTQDGLGAARLYARIAPASPHALHMPAHIFARLGLWNEDIASNLASVAASTAAITAGEPGGAHQMHADEFLIYAYLQTGQVKKAEALTSNMAVLGDHMAAMPGMDDMKDDGPYFDSELRAIFAMETHRWDALASLQPQPDARPEYVFDIFWGRGVAAGHLRDPKLAAAALADFDRSMEALKASPEADALPSLEIKRNEMLGWKAFAEDHSDEAVAVMRTAADQQDKLGQGEVDIPAREMLGDLLLLEHRPKEALTEYRAALKLSPNRLNGLRSAAQAAREAGLDAEARGYEQAAARQTHGRRS